MTELLPFPSATPTPGAKSVAAPVTDRFAELDPGLSPEVRTWTSELRKIWTATGMSLNRFASGYPIDKGTLSRYLNGKRVPRDPWFLNKLLAILVERGKEVSQEVREHLTELQLQALQTAHPHEYRLRRISDELELAEIARGEADRYARTLEAQLAYLIHRNNELSEQLRQIRSAWNAERAALQAEKNDLEQEIANLTRRLAYARQRIVAAEMHRQDLENLLIRLDIPNPGPELPQRLTAADVRAAVFATTRLRPGYDEEQVDDFLDKVESEIGLLTADRDRLAEENAELRALLTQLYGLPRELGRDDLDPKAP